MPQLFYQDWFHPIIPQTGGIPWSGVMPQMVKSIRDFADVAQLVEQLTRNEQVAGSSPVISLEI